MSDNFGPRQPRVLDVENRSLDNVIFQHRTPPLSSEWNLINQISNVKVQDIVKSTLPSGWMKVGDVKEEGTDIESGQILTSSSFSANTVKLTSNDDNVAVVNGWPILVQASSSPDDDNIITLPNPGSQVYDFVFLEVWRKLVGYDDPLYPYGNVNVNPYTNNEILFPPIGDETTKRVQIQYRIRVQSIATTLSAESDVFGDTDIFPIGGRTTGQYQFSSFAFRKAGSIDAGLYLSGDGSETSQEELNTIDGYVYAIPIALAYRRTKTSVIFNASQMTFCFTNKAGVSEGYVTDRPDAKLADVIYKDDIMDLRHKIITSGKDMEDIVNRSVSRLIAGELTTVLKQGFDRDGLSSSAVSGASTLMKVERINSTGGDNIPNIGTGSGTASTTFKRRVMSAAEIMHSYNILEVHRPGATWSDGDSIDIASTYTFPDGELISIDGLYSPTLGKVTGVTAAGVSTINIADSGSNSIVGTADVLLMVFTFKYDSSTYGFKDVPKDFLEINKGTYIPIATRDHTIPVRFNNSNELLNFGLNPNNGEIHEDDYYRYAGGNYTENTEIGHELVVHRTTNSAKIVTLNLSSGKLNGHYILGVKSVRLLQGGSYSSPIDFTVSRTVTVGPPYLIDSYQVTVTGQPDADVRITLYTGSKGLDDALDSYSVSDSFKFFDLSKQGKGIIDTFEMIEALAEEVEPGVYEVNTGDKPIVALATKTTTSGGFITGNHFGFASATGNYVALNPPSNSKLPVLTDAGYTDDILPTRVRLGGNTGNGYVRVPVLVNSYVTSAESPYNFYYKMNPYQGILSGTSEFYGRIENEGPALITSLGSGAIRDSIYQAGRASFVQGTRTVLGQSYNNMSPRWLSFAESGDYIHDVSSPMAYRILTVTSDTELTLAEPFEEVDVIADYHLIKKDVAKDNISNVTDRLPTHFVTDSSGTFITDYHCFSDDLMSGSYEASLIMTGPVIKGQDPMNTVSNDFKLGNDTKTNIRGRHNFVLTEGANEIFRLGVGGNPRPEIRYRKLVTPMTSGHHKKTYQMYLFNRSGKNFLSSDNNLMGRMYLMVISGETINPTDNMLNNFSNSDTVDVYELIGRPLVKSD